MDAPCQLVGLAALATPLLLPIAPRQSVLKPAEPAGLVIHYDGIVTILRLPRVGSPNKSRVVVRMTLTLLEDTGESLFLELSGSLDIAGAREVETRFLAYTATAKRSVVVDFSQVTFLASFGLRMIFEAVRELDRNGKKLVILNPQPLVARTLEIGGVDAVAAIVHDPCGGRPEAACEGDPVGT
jgi:anti-anti-sigma factor